MTGINSQLEALETLYRATVLEFGDTPSWKPVLSEAGTALNVLWEDFYTERRLDRRKGAA